MSLAERVQLEHPVVQAGMGGGIADGRLAGAVSAAGGLGTVGIFPPQRLGSRDPTGFCAQSSVAIWSRAARIGLGIGTLHEAP